MANFRFVTHLDTTAVIPQLVKLTPAKWAAIEALDEGAPLLLRAHHPVTRENWQHDLPVRSTRDLEPWKSMSALLERARRAIMDEHSRMIEAGLLRRVELSGQMARAMITRLDPGVVTGWHADDGPYHQRVVRFHLPLATNPGCVIYAGPEWQQISVGALTLVNHRAVHSQANWGGHRRLHIIFDMYRVEDSAALQEGDG